MLLPVAQPPQLIGALRLLRLAQAEREPALAPAVAIDVFVGFPGDPAALAAGRALRRRAETRGRSRSLRRLARDLGGNAPARLHDRMK